MSKMTNPAKVITGKNTVFSYLTVNDPEAIDNVRRKEDPSAGSIGTDPSVKAGPQPGAGILDRMALGMDRVKEGLTSMATDT